MRAKKQEAKDRAKASVSADDDLNLKKANLPLIEDMVSQLKELAPIATSTMLGRAFDAAVKESGFGATKGKTARTKYQSIIRNQTLPLLKATFGAAFTQAEGQKLEDTLGDINASPDEKIAALDAFLNSQIAQIEAGERNQVLRSGGSIEPSKDDAEYDALKAELGI